MAASLEAFIKAFKEDTSEDFIEVSHNLAATCLPYTVVQVAVLHLGQQD